MPDFGPFFWIDQEYKELFNLAALALLSLIVLAVVLDILRRRKQSRIRLEQAWQKAEALAYERGFAEQDWDLLRSVIETWTPKAPLETMSNRVAFDECVDAELAELESAGDFDEYERVGVELRKFRAMLGLDFVPFGQPISSTRELNTGQSLWISVEVQGDKKWFRTRIAQVDEAHFYAIPWPGHAKVSSPPEAGTRVQCRMWRADDARYRFSTELMRYESETSAWVFHHTDDLERIQSREYYRIHLEQSTTVEVIDRQGIKDIDSLPETPPVSRLAGKIVNLSGGGCAIVVDETVPASAYIRIKLKLPGEPPIKLYARVVDVTPLMHDRRLLRTCFVGTDDDTRDRIAQYVLYRQQLLLAAEEHPESTIR